jgi:hypothetical protein
MPQPYVVPAILPLPTREQQTTPIDSALTVAKDQGELRRLPLYRGAPQAATIAWPPMPQAKFNAFWDWFEDEILSGARRFDIRLAAQGTEGLRKGARAVWYAAQFTEVPQFEALPRGRYRITASLLLFGAAFAVRVAPGIQARGSNRSSGGAFFVAPALVAAGANTWEGAAEFAAAPGGARGTNTWTGGGFMGDQTDVRITVDGDTRVTVDGDRRVTILE